MYAVAYVNFYDGQLYLRLIEAKDPRGALIKLLNDIGEREQAEYVSEIEGNLPDDLRHALEEADATCQILKV